MKRFRSLTTLTISVCLLLILPILVSAGPSVAKSAPGQSTNLGLGSPSDPTWAPTFTLPHDTTITLCSSDSICYPISGSDVDAGDSLTLWLVSGPITYTPTTFGQEFSTTVCFKPETSGSYRFIWKLTDKQSHIVKDTVTFVVTVNHAPVIADQSFSTEICYQPYEVALQLAASDADGDVLTYALLSGNGSVSSSGVLTFTPTSAGVQTFLVSVSDRCGSDTATITDTVRMNLPPSLTWRDSLIHVCNRNEICFDAIAHDPEGGPTSITLVEWPEGLTVGPDRNGHVCFTPNADSATYDFIFCLADECPIDSAGAKILQSPICFRDTIHYTVVVNRGPKIVCPEGQQFFGCKTGPYCFTIDATDPEGDSVTFAVLSDNATIDGHNVCFNGGEPGQYNVVIAATDACGHADTCSVPVELKGGRPPVVTLPDNFTASICEPEQICFQAYADDPDLDIKSIVVNYGTYDKSANRICFLADTTGMYRITMIATDSCGLYSMDTIDIRVKVNGRPSVHLEKHLDSALCYHGELCYNVAVSDDNLKNVYTNFGTYTAATGQVCFTPDSSGLYTIIVSAVDDCNITVSDTLKVRVTVNNPPVISGMRDTTLYLCKPAYVCVPVTVTDADNNIKAVTVNRGKYANGSVCFIPYNQGQYPIIVTAVDECGSIVVDTAIVTVHTDQEVVIGYPKDTTFQLCRPDTLCFPVTGIPADAKVKLKGTNVWWNAEAQTVCFYSDCCIQNTITVEITTACGSIRTGQFTVHVQTNSAPLVLLPQDTTISSCDGLTACFPVAISDLDHNVASVEVTGGQYDSQRQRVCLNADSSGSYLITVRATDSCGLSSSRQMHVQVVKNSAPTVAFGDVNTQYNFCQPTEICLPVISADINSNLKSIVTSLGTYNPATKSICFTPTQAGQYCATVTATDSCGLADTAQLCVNVTFGNSIVLHCPQTFNAPVLLCTTDSICVPITIDGTPTRVLTSRGIYRDGNICFKADTSGAYAITVIAEAACNSDTCTFTVPVIVEKPVHVICGVADTSVFRCTPGDTLRIPVTLLGDPTNITITPAGITWSNGFVNVPVTESGSFTIKTVASNQCSSDSCSFNLHVQINQKPFVTIVPDTTIVACGALGPIKLNFHFGDADNNITQIRTNLGDIDDTTVNFTPTQSGDYQLIITVLDACGAKAVDTSDIHITISPRVTIVCPGAPIPVAVTVPDTVRVKIQVVPSDANVVIQPAGRYDAATGEAVVYVDSVGTKNFRMIATGACNVDTCNFVLDARQYVPPTVECRGSVDTLLCLTEPTTVCMPVAVYGENVQVKVFPSGTYADGKVCFPVSQAGTYQIGVVAYNANSADTCYTNLTVRGGHKPVIATPEPFNVNLCGAGQVCFDVVVSDPDNDLKNITVDHGTISKTPTGAHVCLDVANTPNMTYKFAVTAVDSCGLITTDTAQFNVIIPNPTVVDLGPNKTVGTCLSSQVCVPISFSNGEPDTLTITGGQLNDQHNAVCFTATEAGVHRIIARGADKCGRVQADTVDITITLGTAPTISNFRDTTVYMCVPRNICLPITINDADHNIKSVTVNRGQYANGTVCFVPYTMGTYPIIVTVTDSCGMTVVDTAIATILTDQQVNITYPKDTTIFQCSPDTLCFPVYGIPTDATVKLKGTNVWWDKNKQSVCFYSDCCLQNTITVEVTTACGTIKTGVFTVKVQTNSAPLVLLPRDTSLVQCAPTQLCFPVAVSDIDNNVTNISVTGGTYNSQAKTVCLTPNGTGVYTIVVSATDACGAITQRQMAVTVRDNSKPVITYVAHDTLYSQCNFTQICLPIGIADPDNNLTNVTVRGGTYNAQNGTVCILPTDTGHICATVVATDACGMQDSTQVCVHVISGGVADIQCPTSPITLTKLCKADSVFVPVTILGHGYSVASSIGQFSNGTVRFKADTTGTYTIRLIATAQCSSDTCSLTVPVQILPPVDITCPGNQTVFLCNPDTLCYNFTTSPSVTSVRVVGSAYLNGNSVCIPTVIAGTRTITLIATGQCAADTCSFTYTASFNAAPTITAKDTTLTICNLPQICVPFTAADINGNIQSVTTNVGTISGSTVCFTPTAFGVTNITLTVTDSCGAQATRQVKVTVNEGAKAHITCPDGDQFASICKPDTVYVVAPITPANATVTVLPAGRYNPATGKIAIYINQSGTVAVTIIAASQCANDTCHFNLRVDLGQAPVATSPARIDSTMCLVTPDTLCFPVSVSGTGVQVVVTPAGAYYSAGTVCVPVSTAGSFYVKMTATGSCGVAKCSTLVNVTANQAPIITLPTVTTIQRCPQDTNTICIDGIVVTDPEGNPISITKSCGPGTLTTTTPGHASICFKPSTITSQTFCIEATDGCQKSTRQLIVPIQERPDCDVCQKLSFDGGLCSVVGVFKGVDIKVTSYSRIGGFDLLFKYDASALSFRTASITNSVIQGWEYFTYNLNNGNCGSSCPAGLARLVGIADVNNGAHHPPDSTLQPNGVLVHLEFLISNNQNLGGQFVPIQWAWYDCGDNSLSDPTGNYLYIDNRIYNAENVLVWDENDDVHYPEASRAFGIGAPEACLVPGSKSLPQRCVEFYDGGVCIIHPESIDARGDVNLNGVAYEISDAVVFTNYFVKGLAAFAINVQGQIAATDVNNDGLTLTVADLALLIRVVIGDANPIPKTTPFADKMIVKTESENGTLKLNTSTVGTIGAAYFVFNIGANTTVGTPRLTGSAQGMDMMSSVEGDQLKVLVYNIGPSRIASGEHTILEIPFTGDGAIAVQHAEAADYDGQPYEVANRAASLPTSYDLSQNYPNPFNPETKISFALPVASNWKLQIFNVSGAMVKEFNGAADAGTYEVVWDGRSQEGHQAASGVYFYHLEAGSFNRTMKMVLLK